MSLDQREVELRLLLRPMLQQVMGVVHEGREHLMLQTVLAVHLQLLQTLYCCWKKDCLPTILAGVYLKHVIVAVLMEILY